MSSNQSPSVGAHPPAGAEASFHQRLRRSTITIIAVLGVPMLVLLGLVGFLYDSAVWVDHTDQVISQTYKVEKLVTAVQNGFRGYRLTGNDAYLAPYQAARHDLGPQLVTLARRTADNPAQVRIVGEIQREADKCLAFIDGEIGGINAGRINVRDPGFLATTAPQFQSIQSKLEIMLAREEGLRALREENLRRWVMAVLGLFALGALAGLPWVVRWLRRLLRSITDSYREAHGAAERRASELEVTLTSIGDAVVATDSVGRVDFLNPVAEELTGWTNAEARGRPLGEVFVIFNEYTGAAVESPVDRVLRENIIVGLANHTVLRAKDGKERSIEDSAAPIRNEQGGLRGVILVFHDVSARREKEKLVEENEERLRVLHDLEEATRHMVAPREILAVATRVLGESLRVSRCAYADVQPDGEHFEILQDYTQDCATTVGAYALSRFGSRAAEGLRAGETLVIRDVKAELGTAGGAETFLAIGVQAIVCVPLIKGGRLRAMMAVHQSKPRRWTAAEVKLVMEYVERCWATIERARAETTADVATREVAAGAERFRLLAEVVSLQVWTAKTTGELDFANQECASYFGADLERDVLGNAWAQFVHPEDLPEALAAWQQSLATGEKYEVEFRLRGRDGEYRWFLVRAQAMLDASGKVARWFGTNTDIDALKRAQEEAERAGRSKDDFIATLSHELRTPLTPVLMTAAAMREDQGLSDEHREQLGMIERNIALEARLIDDLLDVTAISKGKLRLREQLSDVHSLMGLALEIVRDEAQTKEIAIERRLGAQQSGANVDPARFQQVIWNLLRNAVKFTPRGGRISLETRDVVGANGKPAILIEVSDSGIGISATEVEKIFKPFEQGGRTGDHRFGGLGLGLAIARAIVDLHGGRITARSDGANQGATFVIELPGAMPPPHGHAPAASDTHQPLPTPLLGSGLRLLLVEDHDATLLVLSRLLTSAGHRVGVARTMQEALAKAAAEKFDLVISDLGLPDGTGAELMEKLRAAYGLRGIALSGYGMEDDVARSRQAGFVAHLIKPVDFAQLKRVLADVTR